MNEPTQEQTTTPAPEGETKGGSPLIGWTIVIAALAIVGSVIYSTIGGI